LALALLCLGVLLTLPARASNARQSTGQPFRAATEHTFIQLHAMQLAPVCAPPRHGTIIGDGIAIADRILARHDLVALAGVKEIMSAAPACRLYAPKPCGDIRSLAGQAEDKVFQNACAAAYDPKRSVATSRQLRNEAGRRWNLSTMPAENRSELPGKPQHFEWLSLSTDWLGYCPSKKDVGANLPDGITAEGVARQFYPPVANGAAPQSIASYQWLIKKQQNVSMTLDLLEIATPGFATCRLSITLSNRSDR
jgi:hypothetical protein